MPKSLRLHFVVVTTSLLLSACGTSLHHAPVEDRNPQPAKPAASTPAPAASEPTPEAKLPPGAENAGKPGYYTVKPGDALIRIALDYGQSWRDLARWNSLDNPNRIEVGQVLRVVPPSADAGVTAKPITSAGKVEPRPLDSKPDSKPPVAAASAPAAAASTAVAAAPAAVTADEDTLSWGWPVAQSVSAGFDEQRNKGLDFAGKPGDPVLAVADGRVVYAGSGLRGYGNLVIIKHNNTYLTAYAHNRAMLVEQDQVVRKGQRIAEMGSTESDTVKLHFEVRKLGKPVDPAKLLPAR
jgi:lipoprotein NlpD